MGEFDVNHTIPYQNARIEQCDVVNQHNLCCQKLPLLNNIVNVVFMHPVENEFYRFFLSVSVLALPLLIVF